MDTIYKTYKAEVKGVNADEGTLDVLIPVSTAAVDRDGEVVEPMAFKKTLPKFMKRPVLVASHDYHDLTSQIGEWTKLKITDTGVEGKPKYYINEGNEQADWGFKLASKGMAAFSIGFIPKEWVDGDGVEEPRRTYKEVELLEISQVIVPSNREAIQSIRSKSVDPIVTEICDAVEKELITKPEETDEYIRIPVSEGHGEHRIRTITISDKEGIKALYCGECKKVITYLFAKDHGWTMAKARAWVKEHEKRYFYSPYHKHFIEVVDNRGARLLIDENGKDVSPVLPLAYLEKPNKISQSEIIDEIDYLKSLIEKEGLSEEAQKSLKELLRLSGSDIPVEDKLTTTDILESIKRISKVEV